MLNKTPLQNIFLEEYPDDFESYSEESIQDTHNETLELIIINDHKKKCHNNEKKLNEMNHKIDLEFEQQLDFLLSKQKNSNKKNEIPKKNSLNFHTPLLGRRLYENIDEWIEKQTSELNLSPESQKTIPISSISYFKNQRPESPSTEYSYDANKKFNYHNPRPTLCGKIDLFFV